MAAKPTSAPAHPPPDLSSLCLAITEHAPLPMATVEGASHIVRYVNPAFCRLMDKPAEQLVGIPFCEMLPERDACVTLLDRVFRTGKPESHTEQEHSKPHPVFWSFTMWPVLADERPVGVMIQVTETAQFHEKTLAMNEALMLGSLRQHELTEAADSLNVQLQREITERKQVEERYRILFASAPMAIFVCDRNAVIQHYNRHAVELWGREPTRGVEQHCGSVKLWLPNGTLLPHAQSPMVEVLRTGIPALNVEVFIERPDGSRVPVLVNFAALKNVRGEITGAITSFMDIAERKQIEGTLKEVDRRKNEFLAMLAHELRNPLAPICSALQIMRLTGGDREAVRSASEMMERQVGQMVRLVDDLLDVSRISRGTIELRKGRIELESVIHHAVEAARPLYASMDHELTITLPPKPIYLNADPTRLAQVVGNLLNNACKFTDKGGRISLSAESEGAQVVIRVRDSGIGIAAGVLPHIFEMFWQVDTSLVRSVSGLGIGLALVKIVVELHDGTVEVHSAGVGQGSEFVVRLPILVEAPKLPPSEPAVSEPMPTTVRRILVVDDNRDSAESLAMLLNLTGHETHTAYDGLEAVEAAARFKPDVILLDIGLPKLNGYEAARRIREQPWGKGIALIALTGWGQEEDRQKSREAGFDGHLVKPVDHAALTKLLAESRPTSV